MRRKRTGAADEVLKQFDHFSLPGNCSIQERELTADNPKMLRIPQWRPALLLTLRRQGRFELFFEGGISNGLNSGSYLQPIRLAWLPRRPHRHLSHHFLLSPTYGVF
jgi:hypothetical protein